MKAKFPPKHRPDGLTKLGDCPDDDDEAKKKFLQRLVTLYHPDRVDKDKHGEKYVCLCEEISKHLTAKYNVAKGI